MEIGIEVEREVRRIRREVDQRMRRKSLRLVLDVNVRIVRK